MYQDQIQRLSKIQYDPANPAGSFEALQRELINTFQSCQPLTQRGTTLFTRNSDGQPTVEIKNALGPALRINGEVEYGDDGPNAAIIMGTLGGALATSDASKSLTVTHYGGGKSPGSSVTVYNPTAQNTTYLFESDSGGRAFAFWDAENEKYWLMQAECPS